MWCIRTRLCLKHVQMCASVHMRMCSCASFVGACAYVCKCMCTTYHACAQHSKGPRVPMRMCMCTTDQKTSMPVLTGSKIGMRTGKTRGCIACASPPCDLRMEVCTTPTPMQKYHDHPPTSPLLCRRKTAKLGDRTRLETLPQPPRGETGRLMYPPTPSHTTRDPSPYPARPAVCPAGSKPKADRNIPRVSRSPCVPGLRLSPSRHFPLCSAYPDHWLVKQR
jgi:hypothetical protein